MTEDMVNKPKHYNNHPSGVECKEIAMYFPPTLANAIKYVWRYEDKVDPKQDLEKTLWYLSESLHGQPFMFMLGSLAVTKRFLDIDKLHKVVESEEDGFRYCFLQDVLSFVSNQDLDAWPNLVKNLADRVEIKLKEYNNDSV